MASISLRKKSWKRASKRGPVHACEEERHSLGSAIGKDGHDHSCPAILDLLIRRCSFLEELGYSDVAQTLEARRESMRKIEEGRAYTEAHQQRIAESKQRRTPSRRRHCPKKS